MNYKGVYRTAPATPGLLKRYQWGSNPATEKAQMHHGNRTNIRWGEELNPIDITLFCRNSEDHVVNILFLLSQLQSLWTYHIWSSLNVQCICEASTKHQNEINEELQLWRNLPRQWQVLKCEEILRMLYKYSKNSSLVAICYCLPVSPLWSPWISSLL